nr:glycosyltransferase family 2 protein [Desulfobulbaceae bacterium]
MDRIAIPALSFRGFSNLKQMNRVSVIIPAYQPGPELVKTVEGLRGKSDNLEIIVVNDGSAPLYNDMFNQVINYDVHLVTYLQNLGKGAALKKGFEYWQTHFSNAQVGVVTADADGQHHVDDILLLVKAMQNDSNSLHLGVRQLSAEVVPWRSQLGNWLSALIFQSVSKIQIIDTQTGLRGVGTKLLTHTKNCKATGYDFEMEMLLIAVKNNIPIRQHPIRTLYLAGNTSSHFKPIKDSCKVYKVFWNHLIHK